MGLMSKIIGSPSGGAAEEYVELDAQDVGDVADAAGMNVHIAEIDGQQDVIAIKDAIYDGDLVVADVTRHSVEDRTAEHIIDELRQVAREVSGDVIQKGDDQFIVTPTGVKVSREKLGDR
jgi:SepF-like predicted cell division protein (DUF552 family)